MTVAKLGRSNAAPVHRMADGAIEAPRVKSGLGFQADHAH